MSEILGKLKIEQLPELPTQSGHYGPYIQIATTSDGGQAFMSLRLVAHPMPNPKNPQTTVIAAGMMVRIRLLDGNGWKGFDPAAGPWLGHKRVKKFFPIIPADKGAAELAKCKDSFVEHMSELIRKAVKASKGRMTVGVEAFDLLLATPFEELPLSPDRVKFKGDLNFEGDYGTYGPAHKALSGETDGMTPNDASQNLSQPDDDGDDNGETSDPE